LITRETGKPFFEPFREGDLRCSWDRSEVVLVLRFSHTNRINSLLPAATSGPDYCVDYYKVMLPDGSVEVRSNLFLDSLESV
jgi:hypothetical protein